MPERGVASCAGSEDENYAPEVPAMPTFQLALPTLKRQEPYELLSPSKMRRARVAMQSWIEPELAADILATEGLDVRKVPPFVSRRGSSSYCVLPLQGRAPYRVLLWRHDERGVFSAVAPSFERFMKELVEGIARGEPLSM